MQEHAQGMPDHRTNEPVFLGVGGLYAHVGDHIGHFYRTQEEWKALLIPFLTAGLAAGDKCVYLIGQEHQKRAIYQALRAAQINVDAALADGQLVLDEGKSTLAELQTWLASTVAALPWRFRRLRWGGDMTWSLQKLPASAALMEWETWYNRLHHPPVVLLCQYDVTQFPGHVVIDALKIHPLCIIGNVIHRGQWYDS